MVANYLYHTKPKAMSDKQNTMGYRKHDKIKAFNPKTKYLTHNKEYRVEWISAGGYIAVRNDAGKIKPYSAINFYKGNV